MIYLIQFFYFKQQPLLRFMSNVAKLLHNYCNLLLSETSSWAMRKEQLENMHALFVQLGALDAYKDQGAAKDRHMPGGKAIAPASAAMCLFDIARTRQFVAAVKQAITDKTKDQTTPVLVLDAGCGPYALLSLLAALYFSPQQVKFRILDIYETNIQSARTLIKALEMEAFFEEMICVNALEYKWPLQQPPDILLTETMNRALTKEPQVAISLRLAPLLAASGILIPEKIDLELVAVDRKKRNELMTSNTTGEDLPAALYEHRLAPVLSLLKDSTHAAIGRQPLTRVELPPGFDGHQLELHTTITVYKQVVLKNNESAVTLPLVLKQQALAGDILEFYYKMTDEPGIETRLISP